MKYCIFCNEKPVEIKKAMLCGACYKDFKKTYGNPALKLKTTHEKIKPDEGYSIGSFMYIDLCHKCNTKPYRYKKHKLCDKCYHIEYRTGNLYKYVKSFEQGLYEWKIKIENKFGKQIHEHLAALKNNPFYTLDYIGKLHGVTRERIRQIYQKYYNEPYTKDLRFKKTNRKADLSCSKDPRNKVIAYKNKQSSVYKGALAEKEFLDECIGRGFDVDPMCDAAVDLKINGWTVDVIAHILNGLKPV